MMRLNDVVALLPAVLAGAALGAFFFGGLWWTVRAIVTSPRAGLVQFASLMTRMAVTLVGFHLVSGSDLARLLACAAGFVIARVIVGMVVRRRMPPSVPMPEVRDAARP